jgi:hypothetical protein
MPGAEGHGRAGNEKPPARQGVEIVGGGPRELDQTIREDIAKWSGSSGSRALPQGNR